MFHVCQRSAKDCGVAVAAMVTEVAYDEVLDGWFGGVAPENGLPVRQLEQVLEGITDVRWQTFCLWWPLPAFATYRFPEGPAVVVIERALVCQHYVAVRGPLVHDPLLPGPLLQARYPSLGCRVHTVLRPTEPDFLTRHRARRRRRIFHELKEELRPVSIRRGP